MVAVAHRPLLLGAGVLLGVSLTALAPPVVAESGVRSDRPRGLAPFEEIRVEEPRGSDNWRVTYVLPAGASGMKFERPRKTARKDQWHLQPDRAPARAHWETCGEDALLLLDGETPRRAEVRVEIPPQFTWVEDYALNYRFTDGGVVLYAGALAARPVVCHDAGCCPAGEMPGFDPRADVRWTFTTAPNRGIRLLERAGRGRLEWRLPRDLAPDDGTFVYFGNLEPVAMTHMTTILDPGLPPWIDAEMRALLPRLFDQFAREIGIELDFRPLNLVSYQPSSKGARGPAPNHSGRCNTGGGPKGVLHLALGCSDWGRRDDDTVRGLDQFLAHEMFHFWNGEMFGRRFETPDSWISEGGTDYVAYRSLHAEGLLSEEEFERALVSAANRCLVNLDGAPLLGDLPGRNGTFYDCGAVLHFAADRALRDATGGKRGLDDLFIKMFRKAEHTDRIYSTFDWLETLQELAGQTPLLFDIERLLHQGIPKQADRFFEGLLLRAGLDVERVAAADADGGAPKGADQRATSYRKLLRLAKREGAVRAAGS